MNPNPATIENISVNFCSRTPNRNPQNLFCCSIATRANDLDQIRRRFLKTTLIVERS